MRTRTILLSAATFIFVLGLSAGVWAGSSFQERQAGQRISIYRGMVDGRITEAEFAALDAEQYRIETYRRQALSDGYLDRREKRRLKRKLDKADRNIRRARTNSVTLQAGWRWDPRYDRYRYPDYWYYHYRYGPYGIRYRYRSKNRPQYRYPPRIRPYGRLHFEYHQPGFGLGWSIGLK